MILTSFLYSNLGKIDLFHTLWLEVYPGYHKTKKQRIYYKLLYSNLLLSKTYLLLAAPLDGRVQFHQMRVDCLFCSNKYPGTCTIRTNRLHKKSDSLFLYSRQ